MVTHHSSPCLGFKVSKQRAPSVSFNTSPPEHIPLRHRMVRVRPKTFRISAFSWASKKCAGAHSSDLGLCGTPIASIPGRAASLWTQQILSIAHPEVTRPCPQRPSARLAPVFHMPCRVCRMCVGTNTVPQWWRSSCERHDTWLKQKTRGVVYVVGVKVNQCRFVVLHPFQTRLLLECAGAHFSPKLPKFATQ